MKIISLNCNHCGAPLDVPAKAKYVTCGFCDSRLQVQHTGNTYSTTVIEQLVEQANQIQEDVEFLKRQAAIAELDERWKRQRSKFTVRDNNGRESIPTAMGAALQAIGATVICGFLGVSILGPIAIVIWLLLCLVLLFHAKKAADYRDAHRRYQQQRRQLASSEKNSNSGIADTFRHGAWN